MSKQKAQGTEEETRIVRVLRDLSRRLIIESRDPDHMEGTTRFKDKVVDSAFRSDLPGQGQPADVTFTHPINEETWLIQVKACQQLGKPPHKLLAELEERAGQPVIVWWKRVVLKPGNSKRSADGLARVVILPEEIFLEMLERL